MTLTTADSFVPNGSGVIDIFVPKPRTLNSFIIKTIAIAALKGKLRSRRFRRKDLFRSLLLRHSNCPIWITSQRERSHSFALSGAIGSWISLGRILKLPKNLSIPMSGLKSSPNYTKSRSIWGKNWSQLFHTNSPLGSPQILEHGKRCPGA